MQFNFCCTQRCSCEIYRVYIKCRTFVFIFFIIFLRGSLLVTVKRVKREGSCENFPLENNKTLQKYTWLFQIMTIEVAADAWRYYYPYKWVLTIATVSTFVCKRPNIFIRFFMPLFFALCGTFTNYFQYYILPPRIFWKIMLKTFIY